MDGLSRRGFLAAGGVAALAGCLGGGDPGASGGGSGSDSGRPPLRDDRLALPMSPSELSDQAQSGGPDKDGIPSIDDPSFVGPDAAGFLDPGDPVFGIERDGVAKAYPQKILVRHEIANDVVAGTPLAITYCPLTGTAMGFERGGTTFGVSGRLINNNLVMYDRRTETWWPQIAATAVPGPWNEDPRRGSLRETRLVWTSWRRWREHHPDTRVLSTDTGHARNYGLDPYGSYNPPRGYYANDNLLFPTLADDDRYDPKTVVIGARTPAGAVAFPKSAVRSKKLLGGELAGTPVLAVHDERYDTAFVYRNPEGAAFEYADGAVVAADGTEHAPDDLPLSRLYAFDAMWFAWVGFYPETNVHA